MSSMPESGIGCGDMSKNRGCQYYFYHSTVNLYYADLMSIIDSIRLLSDVTCLYMNVNI